MQEFCFQKGKKNRTRWHFESVYLTSQSWHPNNICWLARCFKPSQVSLCWSVWHSASVGQYSSQVFSPSKYWYLKRQGLWVLLGSNVGIKELWLFFFISIITNMEDNQHGETSHTNQTHVKQKLTFPLVLCKCLWTVPWWGRFSLPPRLKILCTV